ncbi:MAG: sulfatase-like hydrolase/transferase [Gemmatimonadota bacterium]|nr:sulfatase-like hydrolase/transferase [Gemmatimonadota bacterium]
MDEQQKTRREFLKSTGKIGISAVFLGALPGAFLNCGNSRKRRRPNILLFLPDQHRFDWLGSTPEIPVRTPNLDELSRLGVRFTRAFCASPLCAPSRACLASGKEYDRCRVVSNKVDYPIDQTTFYTILRDSGYHVAGCGKLDLHKASDTWGLEGKHLLKEWGFSDGIDNAGKYDAINSGLEEPKDPYMAFLHRRGLARIHVKDFRDRGPFQGTYPTPLPDDAYCDNWLAKNGLNLMKEFPKNTPWFLQVNFTGPHAPMDITSSMTELYEGVDFPQPNRCTGYDEKKHVEIRRNYSAMVENIDRWMGIYLDELDRRGELENTLIVYSSDHGEMLGDHDCWGKKVPYQPSVGIPMIISGCGVSLRGVVSGTPVSLIDLCATFLEFGGIKPRPDMDSRSLKPFLEGRTRTHRDHVYSGLLEWRMVFDGRYKLISGYGDTGKPILFDLQNDPLENIDIAEEAVTEVARLSQLLGRG